MRDKRQRILEDPEKYRQEQIAKKLPDDFEDLTEEEQEEINAIVNNTDAPSFENTIEAMEKSGELLTKVDRVFYNMVSANTNDEIQRISKELEDVKAMSSEGNDEEMSDLIKQESTNLQTQLDTLTEELKLALLPKDPNDEKDIIMEIRAGTGGNEAALFA